MAIPALIERRPEWKICGEASTGRDTIEKSRRLRPDTVLLDISMPEMDGLEVMPQILKACPSTTILVLTMHHSGEMAAQVLAAGASGLVLKSDAASDLVRAFQATDKDQPFLSPTVTRIILGQLAKTGQPGPPPSDLTPRELDTLKLLAVGRSHKDVATVLDISAKTVDVHRAHIMRKLKLQTYSDLIHFAIRHQVVEI